MLRFLLLGFMSLLGSLAWAQGAGFAHQGLAKDAQRYQAWLKANIAPDPARKGAEVRTAAEKLLPTDARGAARQFASAVVANENDAEAWIGLARALLAVTPDARIGSERYELPVNASAAAYLGYQRAQTSQLKARALAILGEALKRRSYWRPAIDALKMSLELVDNADVRHAYEALRNERGFRLIDYTVESDAAEPRLCIQFSEPLQRAGVDVAKFVAVDGRDPSGVSGEGRQLCIEGLAHGKRYEVLVRAGLPSEVGETLLRQAEIAVYVRDRAPAVRFTGKSYVLPSRGQQGIPLISVNTDKVAIEIYRIGDRGLASALSDGDIARQLSSYDIETIRNRTGARVYAGELDVRSKLNEEVTTAVPVGEALGNLQPGVYAMIARPAMDGRDNGEEQATQWFIVSDLGLTAFTGDTGIHAFVRSLATTEPVRNAVVRLIARNNEVLGQGRSDASGYVRFEPGLARGEGGLQPAILVAEADGGQYAFLDLTTSAFDLSDRGVKGRAPAGALDAWLSTERGVYRPGEKVHLTALVRDRAGKAAAVPTTLIIARPDGVEHVRTTLTDQGLGGRTFTLALSGSAMTGTWRARLHTDPKADPLASVAFLVEDFVPERLSLTLEPTVKALVPEELSTINVTGRYLYGPPAAKLAVEGEIIVKPSAKDLEGFPGYRFGLAGELISAVRKPLDSQPTTDAEGKAALDVTLPAIPRTGRPLEADVIVRMVEPGGRSIERTVTLPVDPKLPRIGIKPLFANDMVGEGETASFEVIALDADSRRTTAKGLTWTLYRLEQSWQWYNRDGVWNFDPVTLTRKVGNGSVATTAEHAARITVRPDWGRFRLEVTSTEPGGPSSSVLFSAGWYGGETIDTPEMLEVALDRPNYAAGDTAKLKIASRQGGKALIAVIGSGLMQHAEADIPKGGGEVAIRVDGGWGAGAYVMAMLYRPMDEAAKRMPSRAVGLKWLAIDQSPRTLKVALEAPERIRSGAQLTVPVKLGGLRPNEEAYVTVAAVDVGILNLTRYQPPRPEQWFYAQAKLGTEIRDLYGRLIDGMRAERGRLRAGGDGGGGMSMQGSPPVEATVAEFSGIVRVGADGAATVNFDLASFNGTVRVMAVAWSADKLGSASRDVIVRDPVALIASAPRFLTLGDEARLQLDLHNVEGAAGAYKLAIEATPAEGRPRAVLAREVTLASGERKAERFDLKPDTVGLTTYDVRLTGPAGVDIKRQLTFDVKPPGGDIRRVTVSRLSPKGGKVTLSADLLADMIATRTHINVSVGPLAAFDVPGLIAQLDRYPYGCAEQIVSRALPLLYANQLAVQAGMAADADLKQRVQGAIDRVFEMQDYSGAFGSWRPSDGNMWLTSYVSDFLTRAKEAGYTVKPQGFSQALDRLQNFIGYVQDFEKGGEDRAYALYVLARNGRAPIGELRYYVDTRLDRFST
ncbi:MAG TPA: alpha-2-macroglobulin, partial [Hyphomicrobiaceae bacterium]|nr:alpha-2-macroglobulin [Hyphomicrobiaceae bacterium]